jgi:hypothetical protein
MEADGREDIEKGLSADAGDYYGVAARLAGDTVPNSRTYAGSLTGVAVGDISAPGPAVSYAAAAGAAPDTTPPVTVSSADDKWHRARVTIRLTATDAESGVASTQYKLDGHAWTSGSKLIVAAPHDHSNDGVHNLRFRSTDKAGNVETAKLCHVRIDTLGPVTLAPVPVTVAHGAYATLPYRVNDKLSPTASVSIRVKKADGVTVKTMSVSKARANTSLRKRFLCGLAPGTYRFFIYAHDLAGNAQTVLGSNTLTVH